MTERKRVTFIRPDPTEHALLVAKLGPHYGNIKQTEHLRPAGTEWATEQDLADAGYVPKAWRTLALRLLELAAEHADDAEIERLKLGIPAEVLTEAHLRYRDGEGKLPAPEPEPDPNARAVVVAE